MSQAATVRALIAQQARTQPQALYAIATETADRIDYAGLEQQCQRVATLLAAQGTQPGDTVYLHIDPAKTHLFDAASTQRLA